MSYFAKSLLHDFALSFLHALFFHLQLVCFLHFFLFFCWPQPRPLGVFHVSPFAHVAAVAVVVVVVVGAGFGAGVGETVGASVVVVVVAGSSAGHAPA